MPQTLLHIHTRPNSRPETEMKQLRLQEKFARIEPTHNQPLATPNRRLTLRRCEHALWIINHLPSRQSAQICFGFVTIKASFNGHKAVKLPKCIDITALEALKRTEYRLAKIQLLSMGFT